jgi:hypothetical protein
MFVPPPPVFLDPPPSAPVPEPTPPPAVNAQYRNYYTSMPNVPVVGSGMVDLKIGSGAVAKQQVTSGVAMSPRDSRLEDMPSHSPGRSSPLDSRIVSTPADKLLGTSIKANPYQAPSSPLSQSGERTRNGTVTRPGEPMSALDFLSMVSESPQNNGPLSPTSAARAATGPAGTVKRSPAPAGGSTPNPYEESTDMWFRFNIINETIVTEKEYVRGA